MTALLTPDELREIQERQRFCELAPDALTNIKYGSRDRRALLRHHEAICERLEAILRGKSMNAYGTHSVDASAVSALVTAIRGEK